MLQQDLLHNVITYSAVISACGKGHSHLQRGTSECVNGQRPQIQAPFSVLARRDHQIHRVEAMLRQGLLHNVITYSALISACGCRGYLGCRRYNFEVVCPS